MHRIDIVGIGPGREDMMTGEAIETLLKSEVIVGYQTYLDLLGGRFDGKEKRSTPMKQEIRRCRLCFEEAQKGKRVAIICSGDAGVYGMAALMYELLPEYPDCELAIVPGITAANSGAALLGAPLNHDYCVISLSDLLTPPEQIKRRLIAAVEGDFAIALYNPSSRNRPEHLRHACELLLERGMEPERACGYVRNIGRERTEAATCTLSELRSVQTDMFTTVFIGNSQTVERDGKLITKRGYHL